MERCCCLAPPDRASREFQTSSTLLATSDPVYEARFVPDWTKAGGHKEYAGADATTGRADTGTALAVYDFIFTWRMPLMGDLCDLDNAGRFSSTHRCPKSYEMRFLIRSVALRFQESH